MKEEEEEERSLEENYIYIKYILRPEKKGHESSRGSLRKRDSLFFPLASRSPHYYQE
jgi:hypothetical protein